MNSAVISLAFSLLCYCCIYFASFLWLNAWNKLLAASYVPLFCSYHIMTSYVIYYWTDAQQHGIYFLNNQWKTLVNFFKYFWVNWLPSSLVFSHQLFTSARNITQQQNGFPLCCGRLREIISINKAAFTKKKSRKWLLVNMVGKLGNIDGSYLMNACDLYPQDV